LGIKKKIQYCLEISGKTPKQGDPPYEITNKFLAVSIKKAEFMACVYE
jgi:hypothetical protein